MTTNTNRTLLTIDQTDALILAACTPEDGAIEDCDLSQSQAYYFFETGTVASVDRKSGWVTIDRK